MSFSIRRSNTNKFLHDLGNGNKVDGFVTPDIISKDQPVDKNTKTSDKAPGAVKMHKTIYAYSDR